GLRFPIRLLTMPTGRARPAGVPGVHQVDRHASPCRLVGDVRSQLEERPGVPLVAMCPTNRCSLADSRQILKSDCLAGYGGFLDELLADAVVGVFLEAGFASSQAADATLGVARAALLEALATQGIPIAGDVDPRPSEVLALAVGGQVGNP